MTSSYLCWVYAAYLKLKICSVVSTIRSRPIRGRGRNRLLHVILQRTILNDFFVYLTNCRVPETKRRRKLIMGKKQIQKRKKHSEILPIMYILRGLSDPHFFFIKVRFGGHNFTIFLDSSQSMYLIQTETFTPTLCKKILEDSDTFWLNYTLSDASRSMPHLHINRRSGGKGGYLAESGGSLSSRSLCNIAKW